MSDDGQPEVIEVPMRFSLALAKLHCGAHVTRRAWATGSELRLLDGVLMMSLRSIDVRWNPTQLDILAEDWRVVGDGV